MKSAGCAPHRGMKRKTAIITKQKRGEIHLAFATNL